MSMCKTENSDLAGKSNKSKLLLAANGRRKVGSLLKPW